VMRIGDQIAECLPVMRRRAKWDSAAALLARTGLPDPMRAAHAYPCELSGGQLQRAMLAMTLAAQPKLLVADEPTTALDVTTQCQVLDLIEMIAGMEKMAVLFITHNLGLVAGRMQRVYVMYAGEIVESGRVPEVFTAARHPYTRGLLEAVPRLDAMRGARLRDLPGTVPSPDQVSPGCAFAPRCPDAQATCHQIRPEMRSEPPHHQWRCVSTSKVKVNGGPVRE